MESFETALENLREASAELTSNLGHSKVEDEAFLTLAVLLRSILTLLGTIDFDHLTSIPVRTLSLVHSKVSEAIKCITEFMIPSYPEEERIQHGTWRPEDHIRNKININKWRGKLETLHNDLFHLVGPIVAQQQSRIARVSTALLVPTDLSSSEIGAELNAPVRRYMPLRNLVKSEAACGVWMSSLKTLAAWSKRGIVDTHEGEVPPMIERLKREHAIAANGGAAAIEDFLKRNGWAGEDFARIGEILSNLTLELEKTFVSSWSKKNSESSTMWPLYGDSGKGVAICTTVGKLLNRMWGVPPELAGKIGPNRLSAPTLRKVHYFSDSEADQPPPVAGLHLPFLKRDEFDDEREIRLVAFSALPLPTSGFTLAANLSDVIDEIVVGPHGNFDATIAEIKKSAFDLSKVPIRLSSISPTK